MNDQSKGVRQSTCPGHDHPGSSQHRTDVWSCSTRRVTLTSTRQSISSLCPMSELGKFEQTWQYFIFISDDWMIYHPFIIHYTVLSQKFHFYCFTVLAYIRLWTWVQFCSFNTTIGALQRQCGCITVNWAYRCMPWSIRNRQKSDLNLKYPIFIRF